VLAGVIGERHLRVAGDAVELAPEAERRREADRASLPITDADRGDGAEHGATGRRHVGQPGGEVAADDGVDLVRPREGGDERILGDVVHGGSYGVVGGPD